MFGLEETDRVHQMVFIKLSDDGLGGTFHLRQRRAPDQT